jgi:hypothetical protein
MKRVWTLLGWTILMILVVNLSEISSMEKDALDATVILYDWQGQKHCTAFAFEKEGQTYRFLTAGHCLFDLFHKEGELLICSGQIGIQGWFKETRFPARLVTGDNTIIYNKRYDLSDGFVVFEATLPRGQYIKLLPFSNEPTTTSQSLNTVSYIGLPDPPISRGHVFQLSNFDCLTWVGDVEYCDKMLFSTIYFRPGGSGSAIFDEKGVRGVIVHRFNIIYENDAKIRTAFVASAIPSKLFLEFWGAYKSKNSQKAKPACSWQPVAH